MHSFAFYMVCFSSLVGIPAGLLLGLRRMGKGAPARISLAWMFFVLAAGAVYTLMIIVCSSATLCVGSEASMESEPWAGIVADYCIVPVCVVALVGTVRKLAIGNPGGRSYDQLFHLAMHDGLTNLANRILFHDELEKIIIEALDNNSSFAIIYLDLDRFKCINDTYGHRVGDLLLVEVSQRIASIKRDGDVAARLGGDEFALIIKSAGYDEGGGLADQLLQSIREPYCIVGHMLEVSVSIGVSIFPFHGASAQDLLDRADAAMYTSKRGGRNAYSFF